MSIVASAKEAERVERNLQQALADNVRLQEEQSHAQQKHDHLLRTLHLELELNLDSLKQCVCDRNAVRQELEDLKEHVREFCSAKVQQEILQRSTGASPGTLVVPHLPPPPVNITLTLDLDYNESVGKGPEERALFERGLKRDLAAATGVDQEHFFITNLAPGSVIASIQIVSGPSGTCPAGSPLISLARSPDSSARSRIAFARTLSLSVRLSLTHKTIHTQIFLRLARGVFLTPWPSFVVSVPNSHPHVCSRFCPLAHLPLQPSSQVNWTHRD